MLKKGSKIAFFVTGNPHKFHEARRILSQHRIAAAMLNIEAVEIQDDSLKEIAVASVLDAAQKSGLPVFVEDAGLFVEALNGFPGPYSNYVYRTLGIKGILKLMDKINHRASYFQSVIAYCDPDPQGAEPLCFEGRVDGRLTYEERGEQGFGFDPIFEPETDKQETFAQMTTEQKNKHSHRAQALEKFAQWYEHRL